MRRWSPIRSRRRDGSSPPAASSGTTRVSRRIATRARSTQRASGRRASRSTARPSNDGGATSPGSANSGSWLRRVKARRPSRSCRPIREKSLVLRSIAPITAVNLQDCIQANGAKVTIAFIANVRFPPSVWHAQGLDGQHPLPDQDPRKGQNRDEPAGASLQYEANDQPLRRQPADAGDRGLTARACRRELPLSRNTSYWKSCFDTTSYGIRRQ